MRIIRFVADDGRVLLGEDHLDGLATVLFDPEGVLGPQQQESAQREILRGKRALVADDDEGIRQTVGAALSKFDCECVACKDGAEAIDAIGTSDLDIVVSDIVMPHHDGYEVFAAAKRRSDTLAVVLITGFGYDPNHTVVRASSEGLEAVLYKPFTPKQLVQKVFEAVRAGNGVHRPLVRTGERRRVRRILAPLTPREILCVGRSYREERGSGVEQEEAEELELFMKPRSAVQDPGKPILLPHCEDEVDPEVEPEGELAVIIGRTAHHVTEAEAPDHVLGFVAANDVTARRWQRSDGSPAWLRGKGFDTFCPIGPAIVTSDELDGDDVTVTTAVNGTVIRRGSTRRLLRPVARLVSEVSSRITLHPGTVLLTGAPPRVEGAICEPLAAGDEVTVEIDGLGSLTNPVAGG